jgi:non-specific serine/threonine protein kinase
MEPQSEVRADQTRNVPTNLMPPPTSFVGREDAMLDVSRLVHDHWFVTLIGAGGCGKTRLAIQAAVALSEQFADGVWFVDLAVLSDGDLVAQTLIRTVSRSEGVSTLAEFVEQMSGKQTLIVFDNCEHVVGACAAVIDTLRTNAPCNHVLATSRHPLGLADEVSYRVPSLSIPPTADFGGAEAVLRYEAPRLFIERARYVWPEFLLTDGDAPTLSSICGSLSGIPLAIELAAARSAVMSLTEMNASIGHLFRLEAGGSKKVLPRQQTLRGLIDWSYNLLSTDEKRLFRRLSVFADNWSAWAAERLIELSVGFAAPLSQSVSELLAALTDKSVIVAHSNDGLQTFSMLPTVRHYAKEKLQDAGEEGIFLRAHCELCVDLSRVVTSRWRSSQLGARDQRLNVELNDFRAALGWAITHIEETDAALILTGELGVLWYQLGFGIEIRQWLIGLCCASTARRIRAFACRH